MHQSRGKTYQWLDRDPLDIKVPDLKGKRVLITGGYGYIGSRIYNYLDALDVRVYPADIVNANILDFETLYRFFYNVKPDIVIHLAAHKYATDAEEIPADIADLNIMGTRNVARLSKEYGAKLVLASTCKAVDPCTAYGASKLIAEKITLNSGGVVFRLVNVIGSTGSVIDIWDNLPKNEPLPTTNALRYWISPEESVKYLLAAIDLPSGLYAPNFLNLNRESASDILSRYDNKRLELSIPLRRGDRRTERLIGEYEKVDGFPQSSIIKIKEPWGR